MNNIANKIVIPPSLFISTVLFKLKGSDPDCLEYAYNSSSSCYLSFDDYSWNNFL